MKIELEISDDPVYCYSNSELCQFVRTKYFGQIWMCALFVDDKKDMQKLNGYEKLIRCQQCLDLEKANKG